MPLMFLVLSVLLELKKSCIPSGHNFLTLSIGFAESLPNGRAFQTLSLDTQTTTTDRTKEKERKKGG